MKQKPITHKVTKELQERIYMVASTLPPMAQMRNGDPVYRSVEVPGTEVTAKDLKPGTPLNPNFTYKINKLQYVNHAVMMTELVKRDGPIAIDNYQADINALLEMNKQVANRNNSPLKKVKQWLQKQARRFKA